MTPQMTQMLSDGPLFRQLSPHVRKCLLSKARPRSYTRGASVCLQGEDAGTLKMVLDGWVKLYRVSASGEEAVLGTLKTGESFDEAAALQGQASQASVEAVSACTVLHFDLNTLCACENAKEQISAAVLNASYHRMDDMMAQIEQLKVQTGAQRLTGFLMRLHNAIDGEVELQLPYEKTVLAGALGMKPESLSRAFSRLKPLGVSSEMRSVRIKDVSALRDFAQFAAV